MEVKQNKAIISRLYKKVFREWNTSQFNEMIAESFQDHLLNGPDDDLERGPDVMHKLYAFLRASFPDLCFGVHDVIAENDKVTVRWSFSGTHKGEFVGVPPKGQAIEVDGIAIYRFLNGKIVERWVSTNLDQLIQRLKDQEPD